MKHGLISILLLTLPLFVNAQNTLPFYIQKAKENSPLIQDNINQIKINTIEAQRLKAVYTKAKIGVTANYLFAPILSTDNNTTNVRLNPEIATQYYGYDLAASNGGVYQALVKINQPLFNGKQYQTVSEVLNAKSKINENNAKISAHDLEKIIADQYILCFQNKMQMQYVEELINLLSEQKIILEKLVTASIYKQSDLTLLKIEQQNFKYQQSSFKANFRRDLMDLNILCGINDTALVVLENSNLELKSNLDKSSFLLKYRLDSLNLDAQEKLFDLKYKPQLNLFANSGLNAVYAPTIAKRLGFSAGISFKLNFFDGGQKNLNKEKIRIQKHTVSSYQQNFITQNTVRKSKIQTELKSYNQRMNIAKQQLKSYNSLINSYKKEIISGQLSIINYITTLKSMALLKRDYTLLSSQKQSLINAYNYWNW